MLNWRYIVYQVNWKYKRSEAAQILGQRIESARVKADLQLGTLACRAGLDPRFLRRVVDGETEVDIDIEGLVRLAAALDLDPGDLVKGIGVNEANESAPPPGRVATVHGIHDAPSKNTSLKPA